jgi:transposase-like protein
VPKPYPPEFRRRALDLLDSGRSVRDVATSLGIAESCLHRWKARDLLDRGLKTPTPEQAESVALTAAKARIAELETEVKILRKAAAAVEQVVPPKDIDAAAGGGTRGWMKLRSRRPLTSCGLGAGSSPSKRLTLEPVPVGTPGCRLPERESQTL